MNNSNKKTKEKSRFSKIKANISENLLSVSKLRKFYDDYDSLGYYDALFFPLSQSCLKNKDSSLKQEVANLFNKGKIGYVFISGGYNGFSKIGPGKSISDAKKTANYLVEQGIPAGKIYSDERSMENIGNFTFPLVAPIYWNPSLNEFKNMLIVGEKPDIWKMREYAKMTLPDKMKVNFYSTSAKRKDRLSSIAYHVCITNALKETEGAKEIHDFLLEEHPFYSENWFNTPVFSRKIELSSRVLKWGMKH